MYRPLLGPEARARAQRVGAGFFQILGAAILLLLPIGVVLSVFDSHIA
jgi:hypothetical protein